MSRNRFKKDIEYKDFPSVTNTEIDNNIFSYHTNKSYIWLHMTYDLHKLIKEYGALKTRGIVNLQLLVAIDKLMKLMDQGYEELQGKEYICMISPLLYGNTELNFLSELGFEVKCFKKKDLKEKKTVMNDNDAKLAVNKFGCDKNVGMAFISIDKIKLPEYSKKTKEKIEEYAKKGISLCEAKELVKPMTEITPSMRFMEEIVN